MNPRHKKIMEKSTLRHITIKLLKTNDKHSQRKKTHYIQRNKDKDNSRFLIGNNTSKKAGEQHLEILKENTIYLQFHTKKKCLSKTMLN